MRVQQILGETLAATGDNAGAGAAFERALAIDPAAESAALDLLALRNQDPKAALTSLKAP